MTIHLVVLHYLIGIRIFSHLFKTLNVKISLILILSFSFQFLHAQRLMSLVSDDEINSSCVFRDISGFQSDNSGSPGPVSVDAIYLKKHKYKTKKHISRQNPRVLRPFGVYINGGGPSFLGASVEYFISSEINLKAGGGWTGAFAGFEYHILGFKKNPWTPYSGIMVSYSYNNDFGVYVPFGFHFIHKYGFSLGFEIALWVKNTDLTEDNESNKQFEPFGTGSVRMGYRF